MTTPLPFDETVLSGLIEEIGADAALRILSVFLAETELALERIATMRGGDTPSDIADAAHTLKSTASTFGFGELASVAALLEASARQPTPPAELNRQIDDLQAAFAAGRRALATARDGNGQDAWHKP
ncbi:MAG TPA: Hpt domain-containing protein [Stellaceae bacterium]|nr:Hpt domain-containing protein [Stellaceae bacterium]